MIRRAERAVTKVMDVASGGINAFDYDWEARFGPRSKAFRPAGRNTAPLGRKRGRAQGQANAPVVALDPRGRRQAARRHGLLPRAVPVAREGRSQHELPVG